jgi:hypothetical protein
MEITYQPSVGPAVAVPGIFDAQYTLLDGGGPASGVEATAPAVFLRLASLPIDPELDDPTLTIAGDPTPANNGTYRVVERRTAGLGSIVLVLRKLG